MQLNRLMEMLIYVEFSACAPSVLSLSVLPATADDIFASRIRMVCGQFVYKQPKFQHSDKCSCVWLNDHLVYLTMSI